MAETIRRYKCSICGKEYENPLDRARCEIRCDEKIKTELEQERQEKLKLEKDKRIEEVNNAYDEYRSTCYNAKEKYENIAKQFIKEYGQNSYSRYINIEDLINLIWEN